MIRLNRVHLCLALFILAVISTVTAVLLCAHQVMRRNQRQLNPISWPYFQPFSSWRKQRPQTPPYLQPPPDNQGSACYEVVRFPTPRLRLGWVFLKGYEDAKMTPSFQINSGDWHHIYIEDIHHQQINHQNPHNCQIWGEEKEIGGGHHKPQTALPHGLGKSRLFWNCWQRTENCCNRFF